jgi:hypothetical protein
MKTWLLLWANRIAVASSMFLNKKCEATRWKAKNFACLPLLDPSVGILSSRENRNNSLLYKVYVHPRKGPRDCFD